MPLSTPTQRGLAAARFKELTAIQRATIPHALCGRDVLGAAKTGSGKTLAFVIPVLEILFRQKWGRQDGLGGLVIAPTRELAMQIFKQLVDAGSYHTLSAGLLIGGKNVKEEKDTVNKMNLLVATPGRLLQHMDETPLFDCVTLKVLVLDEADRILDLGFAATLKAILENLPKKRQTLCFSATQTKSVKDLARLSLRSPEYLAVHAESASATPPKLTQLVATCELDKKMETLWAFIKSHLTSKTLVFLSSCKQVRFVHETFRRMRPGVPVAMLHGRMKQQARMKTFESFARANHVCLFATDVAARGLDFPAVDWVVQADCPEDVPCYIHRVGRTARYTAEGKGLLLLTPSEAKFAEELAAAKVPLKTMRLNQAKNVSITSSIQGLLGKDSELKYLAQRAVVSYLRSVYLQPNKDVFDVDALDVEAFANSVGLPNPPRLRFLKSQRVSKAGSDDDSDEDEEKDERGANETKARPASSAADEDEDDASGPESSSESESSSGADETRDRGVVKRAGGGHFGIQVDGADEDDDLMTVKRADHGMDGASDEDLETAHHADLSVAARARRSPKAPRTRAPRCARARRRANSASRPAATAGTTASCSARTARPWRPSRRSATRTRARFPKAARRSPPRPGRTTTGSGSRGSRRTSRTAPGRSRGCGICAIRIRRRNGSCRATTTTARVSPCWAKHRTTTTRPRTPEDRGAMAEGPARTTIRTRTIRTRTRIRPTVPRSAPRRTFPWPEWR